jgi:hypothetical protein
MHKLTAVHLKDNAAQWRQFPVSEFEVAVSCNECVGLRKIIAVLKYKGDEVCKLLHHAF